MLHLNWVKDMKGAAAILKQRLSIGFGSKESNNATMIKQLFLVSTIFFVVTMNFFCKEQSRKGEGSVQSDVSQNKDSISHENGKKLFGLYCRTCHTFSKDGALLGYTKDSIPLEKFINRVFKDSVVVPTTPEQNPHFKFDSILTKKDISDIKYYLDKG